MGLKSEITDLKRVDKFLRDVSADLPLGFGSIFRIASQYLINWGIEVTEKNRGWIEDQAFQSYTEEWNAGSEKTNEAIEKATAAAELEVGNERLNARLGEMFVRILKDMHRRNSARTFTILDIGAGAGDTITAVMDAMDFDPDPGTKKLAAYCNFFPLEISIDRLKTAEAKWKEHNLYRLLPTRPQGAFGSLQHHLKIWPKGPMFDIVISNAVLHHMPFPEYLGELREKMAEDGVMIIGDWYTVIFRHPALTVRVLAALGADKGRVDEFRSFFKVKSSDTEQHEKALTKAQREANKYMLKYIEELGNELKKIGERLYIFEAHEALNERLGNLGRFGFETRPQELRAKHPGFRKLEENVQVVFDTHDIAAVCAVAKIPPPRSALKSEESPKMKIKKLMA